MMVASSKKLKRGDDGFVQVVCGAPNGSGWPDSCCCHLEAPFPARSIRIRSSLEARRHPWQRQQWYVGEFVPNFGLSDNHDGILEIIPEEVGEALAKPGTPSESVRNLIDIVIDCETRCYPFVRCLVSWA